MATKTIYKITILNWEKYNFKAKKGHTCIMLSKRFLDDAKIQSLPAGGKLLYLGLLLRRGDVDGTSIEASHEDLVRFSGGSGQVVSRLLDQLQSIQLLTYEKITPLYNIIEVKLKEIKLKENNNSGTEKKSKVEKPKPETSPQAAKAVDVVEVNKTPIKFSASKQILVKNELVQSWADTYPKDFLELSLKEMRNWVLSNEHKAPKTQWSKFMNGWFQRGWEKHRKTLGSNPTKLTVNDLDEMLGAL